MVLLRFHIVLRRYGVPKGCCKPFRILLRTEREIVRVEINLFRCVFFAVLSTMIRVFWIDPEYRSIVYAAYPDRTI